MGQAQVSNLEVTVVRRVLASAYDEYVGGVYIVMPTNDPHELLACGDGADRIPKEDLWSLRSRSMRPMNLHQPTYRSQKAFPEGSYLSDGFGLGCGPHVIIQRSPIGILKNDIVCSVSYKAAIILDYIVGRPFSVSQLYKCIALVFKVLLGIRGTICFQGESIAGRAVGCLDKRSASDTIYIWDTLGALFTVYAGSTGFSLLYASSTVILYRMALPPLLISSLAVIGRM